jgi:hypothetical protein
MSGAPDPWRFRLIIIGPGRCRFAGVNGLFRLVIGLVIVAIVWQIAAELSRV